MKPTSLLQVVRAFIGWGLLGLLTSSVLAANKTVVSATHDEANVVVDVQAEIDAPLDLVWAVFNDFDHSACFVKSLSSSHASPLGSDDWLVERVGVLDLGLFSVHLGAKYRVHLDPVHHQTLSQLVSGDAKSMKHSLQLTPLGADRTSLNSHAVVEPPAWFPRSWSQSLLRKQAEAAFQDMLNEVQRRLKDPDAPACSKP